eukprot:UN13466
MLRSIYCNHLINATNPEMKIFSLGRLSQNNKNTNL